MMEAVTPPAVDIKQIPSTQTETSATRPVVDTPNPPTTDVDVSDIPSPTLQQDSGMWGWISHNSLMKKVVETTKHGVDKMITTLDPGMTPYLRQGGDIYFIVTSDKEVKWGAVQEALQHVFGKATVKGIASQSNVAPQPVGYASGLKGAQERISHLRRSEVIEVDQPCISIESFIAELLPDKWFDIGCIILDDPEHNVNMEMFTQAVPIPTEIIEKIQSNTPDDYSMSWSGLPVTVGETIHQEMPWILPSDWHKSLSGQSRKTLIYNTMLTLAGLYKEKLPKEHSAVDV